MIAGDLVPELHACRRRRAVGAALLLIVLAAPAITGCSAWPDPTGRAEPLPAGTAHEIGCTPLELLVHADDELRSGSGVALHERLILTAGHVVPDEPTYLTAFASGATGGEAVRIAAVVRGHGDDGEAGDWAILVLARPFGALAVSPAQYLNPAGQSVPESSPILIAGSPHPIGARAPVEREPVLVRTEVIAPPSSVKADPRLLYVRHITERRSLDGLSGGPAVLVRPGEPPLLVGIHVASVHLALGRAVEFGRIIAVHRVPHEGVRRALELVEAAGPAE